MDNEVYFQVPIEEMVHLTEPKGTSPVTMDSIYEKEHLKVCLVRPWGGPRFINDVKFKFRCTFCIMHLESPKLGTSTKRADIV